MNLNSSLQSVNLVWAKFAFSKLSTGARRRIWLKLSRLLKNSTPVVAAIRSMAERRERVKGKGDPTVIALTDWNSKLSLGKSLAVAVGDWVTQEERMLISAGERAGTLPETLVSAARIMGNRSAIRSAIGGGLAYPAVLAVATMEIAWFFGVKVIPVFNSIVGEDRWTGNAMAMVRFSHLVRDYFLVVVLIIVGVLTAFVASLPRWDSPLRRKLDMYPPFNLYRITVGSTWLIAFAALIKAGIRMEDALHEMASGASPWLRNRLNACLGQLRRGGNVGDAMAKTGTNFPDPEIIDDMGVYTTTTGADEALALLGEEWLDQSVAEIKAGMQVVFVIGLVCVVALMAWLITGLFGMEMQLSTFMKQGFR